MTNVIHGLTREQMAQKVYESIEGRGVRSDEDFTVDTSKTNEETKRDIQKHKKKYNANEAMRMWIEATNKHFGGE